VIKLTEYTKKILDFAKTIISIPSPSGYTIDVISYLEKETAKLGYEHYLTKKGNLVVEVKGKTDYTVGLSGHVDTLGAMVRSIMSDGNLKFTAIGGPIWPTLDGEYCTIKTRLGKTYTGTFLSTSPATHVFKDASTKSRDPENMIVRIDEVVQNKVDTEKLGIAAGDFIFFDPKTVITDSGYIKSRFLDDKLSVSILFGLLNYIKENNIIPKNNLKIIISTYEEVGHGASYIPLVDELIAVDMGCIGDDLSCTENQVSICCKDSSGPYDFGIISKLVEVSKTNAIDYATDIYPYYGSDVSAAYRGGQDIKGALIGPGVHASHGMERSHALAVENTFKLLINYIK